MAEREVQLKWNPSAEAQCCADCGARFEGTRGSFPQCRYIITGHDHTDETYFVCVCSPPV